MSDLPTPSPRDEARSRLIDVAAELLATQGPDAVTTRSVAVAAGVQAPMIYRLFGDKDGLLTAVAEHGFRTYLEQKPRIDTEVDPIDDLRAGWELHVGFGLANPALFRLMHTAELGPDGRSVAEAGGDVLRNRVRRVAQAGRLAVAEARAVQLIRAAGTGVVFTLIDEPPEQRDEALADLAWAGVCAVILTEAGAPATANPTAGPTAAAAVTLRSALPDLEVFTPTERGLLADWLDRVAGA